MSLQVCFGTVGLIVVVTSQAQSIVDARTLDRHFLVLFSYLAAAQQGPESLTQFMQLCIGHVFNRSSLLLSNKYPKLLRWTVTNEIISTIRQLC